MTDYPKWAWSGSRNLFFLHFWPYNIVEIDEAGHFKFVTQIEHDECWRICDRLSPNEVCLWSHDLL